MSTAAQIAANQANSQHSSGPKSPEGKAAASQNNFRHGLTGPFLVLSWENGQEYQTLTQDLLAEHQPATPTELILVREMAQSHWLRQRAITLQNTCLSQYDPTTGDPKQLALYLRYQTTHNRAFYKALNELQKLRAQKRNQQIGFVSQKRKEEREASAQAQQELAEQRRPAQETRREAAENRAAELHQARVWLTEAQARRHETETTIAQVLKMPPPAQSHGGQTPQNPA